PWDFVLMLEGTIVFRSSVVRRSAVREPPQAAAPFAVRGEASGFASATEGDKNRGEQWMPLWDKPCTSKEMAQLFSEGRCQQGRGFATRPVEFARALAQLGVARGVTAFERFGYIERNGQANLATPLGRWVVSEVPYQHLVDEVAPWVEAFRRLGQDEHAPASFPAAARRCDEAVMACCRRDASHHAFSTLIVALGHSEALALLSPKFAAKKRMRPLPSLSPGWLEAAGVLRTCEGRLALALANLHGLGNNGFADLDDPLRNHWLACVRKGRSWAFHVVGEQLHRSPHQVCFGRRLPDDLTAVLQRRLIKRQPASRGSLGLTPAGRAYAELGDVTAFIQGATDDSHLLDLVRPLGALAWDKLRARPRAEQSVPSELPTI
ncbi:MAG: type I-G CRISPR-associated protein Cas8g1/Csx17, partial [Nannocystaceae bacterium]